MLFYKQKKAYFGRILNKKKKKRKKENNPVQMTSGRGLAAKRELPISNGRNLSGLPRNRSNPFSKREAFF